MGELNKRCWTFIHCPLWNKCEHPHKEPRLPYFQPEFVGEHCHFFSPIKVKDDDFKFQGAIE